MKQRARREYHHGNLRAQLIDFGVEILRREGVRALTLRGVARAAGVSQAAPYRHFGDKGELLSAVAAHGFSMLYRRCGSAMAARDPHERLHQLGRAYVHFALDEPAMFRLMFGAELGELEETPPELAAAGGAVLAVLHQAVADIYDGQRASKVEVETARDGAWSLVHGLASLLIDGRLKTTRSGRSRLIADVTGLFVRGLGGSE